MTKFYFVVFTLLAVQAHAQLSYDAGHASISNGSYNDLGATGSRILYNMSGDTIKRDDDNSGIQNIGFSFMFNGVSFTQFVLNTNGFIRLGNRAPVVDTYDPLALRTDSNLIYPFGFDLDGSDSTEWRVYTEGPPGSRVCTIQYKNVRDWTSSVGQYKAINFQIKLYESTNAIQYVYGNFTPTTAQSAAIPVSAGIKGSDPIASVNASKSSIYGWLTTTFISGRYGYTSNKFNNRNDVLPVPGVSITFSPIILPNSDAAVLNVYSLGKFPINSGSPHYVIATIKNLGSTTFTNLPVTLNITGANTFTSTKNISVSAGNTVSVAFDGFTPAVQGAHDMVVSVPLDDVPSNNTNSFYSQVTSNTFSYADTSSAKSYVGYNTGAGLLLAKYHMNGTGRVTQVNVRITDQPANVGQTVYGVVVNSAGTVLAQSTPIVLSASDLGTYKSFSINAPPSFTDTVFLAGLAQTPSSTGGYYPVSTQTEGPPSRRDAYYTLTLSGGTAPTQITTVGRLMIEAVVVDSITAHTITVTNITRHQMCSGDTLQVSYNTVGTFTPGNIFNAELSDATGSFASPVIIGSLMSTTSGTIDCRLPPTLQDGNGYKIRVTSIAPLTTGITAPDVLIIHNTPHLGPDITVTICSGTVDLTRYFNLTGFIAQWNTTNQYAAPPGTYRLVLANTFGCTDTAFIDVVGDIIKPKIPVLADIEGSCTVTAPRPMTTDNCAGTVNGTTSDPMSYNLPGTYIIHWTFTDSSGNTISVPQKVIVYDSLPIIHTMEVGINADSNKCSATRVVLPSPVAKFACVVVSETNDHPSTTYPLGETLVKWTVVDNKGRTSYIVQRVVVFPVLPSIKTQTDTGQCSVVVNLGTPFTSSDCSGYSIVNDHPSTTFPIGVNLVTWTITDGSGKVTKAYQFVSVTSVLPVIRVNADSGSCSATNVIVSTPLSASCSGYTMSSDHASTTYGPGVNAIYWTFTSPSGKLVRTPQYIIVKLQPLTVIRDTADNGSCSAFNVNLNFPAITCTGFTIANNHPSTTYPVGLTTVDWAFTNAAGRVVLVLKQYVGVKEFQKPVLTPPSTQTICSTADSTYSIPLLVATDNCSIASITYKIQGATNRVGNGNSASGVFSRGISWIYWRVTDSSGNVQAASTQVIVKKCASILASKRINQETIAEERQIVEQRQIIVYPNPTTGSFNLDLSSYKTGKVRIEILSNLGKTIEQKDIELIRNHQIIPLDLSGKPRGIYFVKVIGAENSGVNRIIVE